MVRRARKACVLSYSLDKRKKQRIHLNPNSICTDLRNLGRILIQLVTFHKGIEQVLKILDRAMFYMENALFYHGGDQPI